MPFNKHLLSATTQTGASHASSHLTLTTAGQEPGAQRDWVGYIPATHGEAGRVLSAASDAAMAGVLHLAVQTVPSFAKVSPRFDGPPWRLSSPFLFPDTLTLTAEYFSNA